MYIFNLAQSLACGPTAFSGSGSLADHFSLRCQQESWFQPRLFLWVYEAGWRIPTDLRELIVGSYNTPTDFICTAHLETEVYKVL